MACGVPVVTCLNSSLKRLEDAVFYVEPYDVDAMAEHMRCFDEGTYSMELLREKSINHINFLGKDVLLKQSRSIRKLWVYDSTP